MAKFKPVRAKGKSKSKTKSNALTTARGAIPCLILVLAGIALITLMFYFSLKSSVQ
ncbi:MAG TPA: hypothetical protein VN610_12790 [Bryobacteraceae bacterium]|nr:hypothetical protein [Bryobacteraceae bacterium]